MADGDPILTRELAWMSIYDYYFRILALKKRQDARNSTGKSFSRDETWP
jgi:hypothetical protein